MGDYMKYIIMADGKETRWSSPDNLPKHLVKIKEETLLNRTIRLIKKYDDNAEIIITSHDKRYDNEYATRYEPKNNELEIDRFTEELIEDNICFLYGDTYYTDTSIQRIINESLNIGEIDFFGNEKSIVAIKVYDSNLFTFHVKRVRSLYIKGVIKRCIGWQVYASYNKSSFDNKKIGNNFILLDNDTTDFNEYDEYLEMINKL